jgi:hypothetical protein
MCQCLWAREWRQLGRGEGGIVVIRYEYNITRCSVINWIILNFHKNKLIPGKPGKSGKPGKPGESGKSGKAGKSHPHQTISSKHQTPSNMPPAHIMSFH